MNPSTSNNFGTESIGKLLIKQAVPASIGILVMSLNILVDTIFVGHWIGSQAIAAINVVLPGTGWDGTYNGAQLPSSDY